MITLTLTAQSEKVAPENEWGLTPPPLYHQYRTARALSDPATHLVVNSYNTGTGKTRASFLHLFALNGRHQDILLIAPTNALLGQHAEDAREFVQQYNLDYKVIPVTAATVRQYRQQIIAQGLYSEGQMRSGEVLFRLIQNYREFHPGEYRRQGLVFVTNPDIFYYALMFQYGTHDQRNLFQSFLTRFNTIIIDEFHYYDQKQLAFFLFFFAISKKMGYFEHTGRKICLLSATPNNHVISYLNQLFGDNWQHISPDNEPPESANLPTIPTLAPLTLTLTSDKLEDWGKANTDNLKIWLNQGEDGAIISDSLRRVNRLYAQLRRPLTEPNIGRITGPEPETARQAATGKPLILATPTVDIGYNFKKLGKTRQNIDFLVCEARFGDDLIQRIGRAGRVLGKTETDTPSRAIALLKEGALDALRSYNGQTLTRAQFKAIIQDRQDVLPHKHNLTGYIRTHAITEIFYPLYRTHLDTPLPEEKEALEELYRDLCQLFGVRGGSFQSLSGYFRKFYYRQKWLRESQKGIQFNLETAKHTADWFKFRGDDEYDPQDLLPYLQEETVLAYPEQQTELRRFVEEQVQLTRSLFNFRDSFQGPTAVFHDPDHLHSTETINSHDIFHIIETYHVQWLTGRNDFIQLCGETELRGDFYGRIHAHRDTPLRLELHHTTDMEEDRFKAAYEGRPVAITSLELVAKDHNGGIVPLDDRIRHSLRDQHHVVLLIDEEMKGWAINALRHSPWYGRTLTITFPDRANVPYTAYLGKAAWLAWPELQVAYKIRKRMKSEAIII